MNKLSNRILYMKKFRFLAIKKRVVALVLFGVLVVGCAIGAYYAAKATASPKPTHTIVIDAGHGGADVKLGHMDF